MGNDDVLCMNAECIYKLIKYEQRRIEQRPDIQMKIATNDEYIKKYVKKYDDAVSVVHNLVCRRDYRKALIYVCLLHRLTNEMLAKQTNSRKSKSSKKQFRAR